MDNPAPKYFTARVMAFTESGEGDLSRESAVLAEVVDSGKGFVEFAFSDDGERMKASMRGFVQTSNALTTALTN